MLFRSKTIYDLAGRNERVKDVVQHTYATLYAAETNPRKMKKFVEDIIVDNHMSTFETDVKDLLNFYKDKGKDEK